MTCSCTCHTGWQRSCSVPGGCGSEGCGRETEVRCTDRCAKMTDRGLCDWCLRRLEREVGDLPGLWAALEDSLEPGSGGGPMVSGSRDVPIGLRVDVLSFLGSAAGEPSASAFAERGWKWHQADQAGPVPMAPMLSSWCRLLAEERGLSGPQSAELPALVTWVTPWLTEAAKTLWADDMAAEVHQAWRTARALAGLSEPAQRVERAEDRRYCPYCNSDALYADPGLDTLDCQVRAGGCGRRMTREDYDRMCAMQVAHLRQTGAA